MDGERKNPEKARDDYTGYQEFVEDMVVDEEGFQTLPKTLDVSVQPKALRNL